MRSLRRDIVGVIMLLGCMVLWRDVSGAGKTVGSSHANEIGTQFRLLESESEAEEELSNSRFEPKRSGDSGKSAGDYRTPFPGTLRSSSQEAEEAERKEKGESVQGKPRGSLVSPGEEESGAGSSSGRSIECVCDTPECELNSQPTCFTTGHCYTQLLHTDDGTPPLTNGCIPGETPLLCENRRPSSARHWPYLICCNTHLCNAAGIVSLPPGHGNSGTDGNEGSRMNGPTRPPRNEGHTSSPKLSSQENETGREGKELGRDMKNWKGSQENRGQRSEEEEKHVVSPLASSFLIGGAVVIFLISVVGFYILRRERSRPAVFYEADFEEERREDPEAGVSEPSGRAVREEAREPFTRKVGGVENETCLDESETGLKSDYERSEEGVQDEDDEEPESKC